MNHKDREDRRKFWENIVGNCAPEPLPRYDFFKKEPETVPAHEVPAPLGHVDLPLTLEDQRWLKAIGVQA